MNACRLWLGIVGTLLLQGQSLIGAAAPKYDLGEQESKQATAQQTVAYQTAALKAQSARDALVQNFLGGGENIATLKNVEIGKDSESDKQLYSTLYAAINSYQLLETNFSNWRAVLNLSEIYDEKELEIMYQVFEKLSKLMTQKAGGAGAHKTGERKRDVERQAIEMPELAGLLTDKIPSLGRALLEEKRDITVDDLQDVSLQDLNKLEKLLRDLTTDEPAKSNSRIKNMLLMVQQKIRTEFQQFSSTLPMDLKTAYDTNKEVDSKLLAIMPWEKKLALVRGTKDLLSIDPKVFPEIEGRRPFLNQILTKMLLLMLTEKQKIATELQQKYQGEFPSLLTIEQLTIFGKADLYTDLRWIKYVYDILSELESTLVIPFRTGDGNPRTIGDVDRSIKKLREILEAYTKRVEDLQNFDFNDIENITPDGLKLEMDSVAQMLSSSEVPLQIYEDIGQVKKKIASKSFEFLQRLKRILVEGLRLSDYGLQLDAISYLKMLVWFNEVLGITRELLGESAQEEQLVFPAPLVQSATGGSQQATPSATSSSSAFAQPYVPSRTAGAAGGQGGDGGGGVSSATGTGPAGGGAQPQAGPQNQAAAGGAAAQQPQLLPVVRPGGGAALVKLSQVGFGEFENKADVIHHKIGKLQEIIKEKNDIIKQESDDSVGARKKTLDELKATLAKREKEKNKLKAEAKKVDDFIKTGNDLIAQYTSFAARVALLGRQQPPALPAQSNWRWILSWRIWFWNWRRG